MKIVILVIGDEIVEGQTLDTNSAYIAKRLTDQGLCIDKVLTVADSAIAEHVKTLWENYDVVITTGGLGPTHDDLTQEVLEKTLPFTQKDLKNDMGQASGIYIENAGKLLFALPGVARECEDMFEKQCLKEIVNREKNPEKLFMQRVNFAHMAEKQMEPNITKAHQMIEGVSVGSYPHFFVISLILRAQESSQEAFVKKCEPIVSFLQDRYRTHIFFAKSGRIEEALHNNLVEQKKTLALAESCTGGSFASMFTKMPGASQYFKASIVVYADEMKKAFLQVSENTLKTHGAVSEEVVREMAEGLLEKAQTDYVITVSGIAGPDGGTEDKPVGTIFAAIGEKNGPIFSGKVPHKRKKSRLAYMEATNTYLACALFRYITYQVKPFDDQ